MEGVTIIDLSQPIYQGMPVYPGHVKTVMWTQPSHFDTYHWKKTGFSYEARGLIMSDHGPTHVDAINHLTPRPGAKSIVDFPLEDFFTEGICLDVSHVGSEFHIQRQHMEEALEKHGLEIKRGDTVLLWTGHYDRNYGKDHGRELNYEWLYEYPGLDEPAMQWLVDCGIVNLGVDAPSIDNYKDTTYPAHSVCRDNDILNIENLMNLDKVAGRRFIFCGLPLQIQGGTGSPIRAVALFIEAMGFKY
ncbi:MAG: cyclase family protein [Nitrospinota bacterium]